MTTFIEFATLDKYLSKKVTLRKQRVSEKGFLQHSTIQFQHFRPSFFVSQANLQIGSHCE
jgi:hypothetical protein